MFDSFRTTTYVDNYVLIRGHYTDDDRAALIATAFLTSDHVRMFILGEEGSTDYKLGHHDRHVGFHH